MKISRQKLSKDPRLAKVFLELDRMIEQLRSDNIFLRESETECKRKICMLAEEVHDLNEQILKQRKKYLKKLSDQKENYLRRQRPLWPGGGGKRPYEND